jgi:segregation and condensation protein B
MPCAIVEKMSLKAKIESVIYAAEEPVTLAQLAGIFAQELPPAEPQSEEKPGSEPLIKRGDLQAEEETVDSAAAEAEAKRIARQRDRQVREQLKAVVDELIQEYAGSDRGMEIREVAGGYRIATKPEYHDAVRAFVKSLKPPMKLSLQALETLAVIAYKQPITAPEVAEIRGVDSSGVLGSLVSRKLITTAGRKQVIGRPILYKTTREFLLRFGLKDLNELPSIEEFEKLAGDIEISEDEITEVQPESANLPFEEAAGATDEGDPPLTTVSPSSRGGLTDSPAEDPSRDIALSAEEEHVTHS